MLENKIIEIKVVLVKWIKTRALSIIIIHFSMTAFKLISCFVLFLFFFFMKVG